MYNENRECILQVNQLKSGALYEVNLMRTTLPNQTIFSTQYLVAKPPCLSLISSDLSSAGRAWSVPGWETSGEYQVPQGEHQWCVCPQARHFTPIALCESGECVNVRCWSEGPYGVKWQPRFRQYAPGQLSVATTVAYHHHVWNE